MSLQNHSFLSSPVMQYSFTDKYMKNDRLLSGTSEIPFCIVESCHNGLFLNLSSLIVETMSEE